MGTEIDTSTLIDTPAEDGTPYQHTGNEGRDSGIRPQLLNRQEFGEAMEQRYPPPLREAGKYPNSNAFFSGL